MFVSYEGVRTDSLRTCVRIGWVPGKWLYRADWRRLMTAMGVAKRSHLALAGAPAEPSSRGRARRLELDCRDGCYACQAFDRRVLLGAGGRRPKLMEKFVIEGGVPLSGTMVPAGNKNGALPILAASVLTEDEVLVRNVPRIRDVDAMIEILGGDRRGCRAGADRTSSPCAPRASTSVEIEPRARRVDPGVVPARRPAARPLPPRRDAAAGRRRDRPPAPGSRTSTRFARWAR